MTWTAVWCEASGEWDRLSGGDQVLPKGLKAHLSPGGSVALGSVFSHAIRRLVKVPKCGAVCYRQKHLREQNLALPALQISELLFTVVMEHDCHLTLLVQEHPSCLKWLLSTRLLLACCIKNISEVEVHARVYCALVNVPLMVARVLLGLGGFSQPINNLLHIWGEWWREKLALRKKDGSVHSLKFCSSLLKGWQNYHWKVIFLMPPSKHTHLLATVTPGAL